MRVGDVVMFRKLGVPPVEVGEVVGFTPKRVRIAVRRQSGYVSVLRAESRCKIVYKRRSLV